MTAQTVRLGKRSADRNVRTANDHRTRMAAITPIAAVARTSMAQY